MEQNLENNDWKKEAPILSGMLKHNPFSVPEGYFDELSEKITAGIYLETLKVNAGKTGFTVPENYFEDLNESIHANIITERIRAASGDLNAYAVPENYFEQLTSAIQAKTINESNSREPGKIVRLWHSNLLKYASAACFLIVASLGLYFNRQAAAEKSNTADFATEQMLFDIDEDVIIDQLETSSFEHPKPIASDAALESYILANYSQNDLASNL